MYTEQYANRNEQQYKFIKIKLGAQLFVSKLCFI